MEKGKNSRKSMLYTIKVIWQADKGCVIYPFYKNISESVFDAFFVTYLVKYIYECIEKGLAFRKLAFVVTLFCSLHIVVHFTSAGLDYYKRLKKPKVYKYIFLNVMDKAKDMELVKFEQPEFYDKYSRALDECLNKAVDGIEHMSIAIGGVLGAFVSAGVIATVDAKLLIFTLPSIFGGLWCGGKMSAFFYKMREEETKDRRGMEYIKRVFYEKKYAAEIRLYPIKNVLFRDYKKDYTGRYETNLYYRKKIMKYYLINAIVFEGINVLLAYLYITYVLKIKGTGSVGAYVAIVSAIGYVSYLIREACEMWLTASRECIYMINLKEFLEYKVPEASHGNKIANENVADIEFDHVTFTYEGSSKPVIEDLCLHVKKGEKIALVGENGAGKTTLIKLLMGLYSLTGGEIKAGGIPIQEYEPNSYHERFGAVFQDLQVFSLSLVENVLMKQAETEEERELVKDALVKAQFGDVLEALPDGIDTMITREFDDSGFVCSGGQAQKIAIARVFAKNPDVVILDEPSSALDPIAEFNMYHNMMEASKGKTVFFISHRMSSARIADKIFFLEHGKIVESGTHDELMKKNGRYASMFLLQAKNYRDEVEVRAYE